jgi:hypothetical protein
MTVALLSELLHAPRAAAMRCREADGARAIAATALLAIVVGCATFGAVVGGQRGGAQIAVTALKLPLVTIVTLSVCGPALYVLAGAVGYGWPLRTVLGLSLAAGARSSLVLFALAPVLWLAIDLGASYHSVKLMAASAYALAGASALGLMLRGIDERHGRRALIVGMVAVFAIVGGQTAWVLRPYIGQPSDAHVPLFVHRVEGGLARVLLGTAARVFGGHGRDRD